MCPELESVWLELLKRLNVEENLAKELFAALAASYSSRDRHYHTLEHIQAMLTMLELYRGKLSDYAAVMLAVWFHDVVYDPRRDDNEEQSAQFARHSLQGLVSAEVIEKVEALILSTKTHQAHDSDAQMFLDADLTVLGSASEAYWRYCQAIRQEYSWVSEEVYRMARKRLLQNFLNRDTIYLTQEMSGRLEAQARRNLENEIKFLSE